jgi:hypothetical protein
MKQLIYNEQMKTLQLYLDMMLKLDTITNSHLDHLDYLIKTSILSPFKLNTLLRRYRAESSSPFTFSPLLYEKLSFWCDECSSMLIKRDNTHHR